MKRVIPVILILVCLSLALGCSPKKESKVFAWTDRDSGRPIGLQEAFDLPEGEELMQVIAQGGKTVAVATRSLLDEGDDPDAPIYDYRLYDPAGERLLTGAIDMLIDGVFVWCAYFNAAREIEQKVYDCTGKLLYNAGVELSVAAVDDSFVAVYSSEWSQLVDREGRTYLAEGSMSVNETYSVCDKWLLTYSASDGAYGIWELSATSDVGVAVLLQRYVPQDTVYSVAYLGDGRFWVVTTGQNVDGADYVERVDDKEHVLHQTSRVYNAKTGETSSFGEGIVLGLVNAYSPQLAIEEKTALPYPKGYTAANTALLQNGVRVGSRYVVIDNASGETVASFPYEGAPLSTVYSDGNLFLGGGEAGYAVALYDKEGNLRWRNDDHPYQDVKWSDGRLTCAYLADGWLRYGAFDQDGKVAVPFVYGYISPFAGGRAVAYSDGYCLIDQGGAAITPIDPVPDYPMWGLGLYAVRADDEVTLYNFAGETLLLGASNVRVDRDGEGSPLVVATQGGVTKVWRVIYG